MIIDRKGSVLRVSLNGAIGESTPLFTLPLNGVTEITLDMKAVTYINSIGVKHWILWTLKIPINCTVKLENCPFVIVSQANTVMGFIARKMTIESFYMPYVCESCSFEDLALATRGKEFNYATATHPSFFKVSEHLQCPKCKQPTFEPDFLFEKTFKFIT